MNTFLMWLGGLLIAVLALLFAGPHFVDWNSYRGVFEEEASRLLGRRVRVGGDVNVRLLPAPYVLFENLRIADTTGLAGQPLFKTDSFKMWLAVPPLLKGAFEANKVELERPVLALATDRAGYGNWRSLLDIRGLPFVPSGVKLDSVSIRDGTLIYAREDGGELTRVENITGDLSAEALQGPYNFLGEATLGTSPSQIRLATTEADDNGSFRLTARVRNAEARSEHRFDGFVSGFVERPSVAGELVSRLSLQPLGAGATQQDDSRRPPPPLLAEVRAQAQADASALKLAGLTISFDEFDQPQLITGELTAQWAQRHKIELFLGSRWLDVDLLLDRSASGSTAAADTTDDAAAKPGVVPLPTARRLVAALLDVFPGKTDVDAMMEIDQINLGRDRVSNLVIAMARSGGNLRLQTLRAVLPGGSRLNFSGAVEAFEGKPVFDGELFLGGVSAARVIQWAVADSEMKSLISDGPFSISGRMRLGTRRVMLRQASAEFSGMPVSGSLVWDDAEKPLLQITAEGYEIDTRWFGLGKLDMPAARALLSGGPRENATSPSSEGKNGNGNNGAAGQATTPPATSPRDLLPGWLAQDDRALMLDLKAGRLVDGETTLEEVTAKLEIKSGRMVVDRLALTTADGLRVDLDGQLDISGERSKGGVNYVVAAPAATAAHELAEAIVGPDVTATQRERFAALAPIRLAGRAAFGQRSPTASDFVFNGAIARGRLDGRLALDGGLNDWTRQPVDLVLRSDVPDIAAILASLGGRTPGPAPSAPETDETAAGAILLKASGIPEQGVLALATIESRPVALVFDGKAHFEGRQLSRATGELQLKTTDARGLIAIAGLSLPEPYGRVDFDGLADIAWRSGRLEISPRDALLSGSRVAGRLVLQGGEGRTTTIDGKLKTDRLDLATVLSGLLAGGETTAATAPGTQVAAAEIAATIDTDAGGASTAMPLFSDKAFDFSALEGVEGKLDIETARLDLRQDWRVSGAHLVFALSPNQLTVDIDKAKALGGTFKAALSLDKRPAGAALDGKLHLTGIELDRFPLNQPSAAAPLGSGKAAARLAFKGSGLTPRGIVPVLTGEGTLTLTAAELAALTPDDVRRAAEEALAGEEVDGAALNAALDAAAGTRQVSLGTQEAKLTIVDGAVRVAPIDIPMGPSDAARLTLTLDVATAALDSEWQVTAADPQGGRPWPPVAVSRVGALSEIGAHKRRYTTDALQRELAVRKMERNVKELERLRKLDEEAAERQREIERLRELESQRIEAERAAAAAAAAAVSRGQSGTVPLPADASDWVPRPSEATPPPAAAPGDSSAIENDASANDAAAARSPPSARREIKSRPRKKPKSFPNQVFGFE